MKTLIVGTFSTLALVLLFGMVEALAGPLTTILSLIFISLLIKTIVTESIKARNN